MFFSCILEAIYIKSLGKTYYNKKVLVHLVNKIYSGFSIFDPYENTCGNFIECSLGDI